MEEDNTVTVELQGGLRAGHPVIVLCMTKPQLTMSLEEAKSLLKTIALCIETTEQGHKLEMSRLEQMEEPTDA